MNRQSNKNELDKYNSYIDCIIMQELKKIDRRKKRKQSPKNK